MSLKELKQYFLVQKELPPEEDFKTYKYHSRVQCTIEGEPYWIIFENVQESILYDYLNSPRTYQSKEKLFGASLSEGYAYVGSKPEYVEIVLPNKWSIDDNKNKRELTVLVTSGNDDNYNLLHNLYSQVRNT